MKETNVLIVWWHKFTLARSRRGEFAPRTAGEKFEVKTDV